MNDEKKLNDETLEKVSGGGSDEEKDAFFKRNCLICRRYTDRNCSYGTYDQAFEALGCDPRAKCPQRLLILY